MTALLVEGSTRLQGIVSVEGSKYVALAAIPAALLADSPSTIENLPDISDVQVFADILTQLGAKVEYTRQGWMTIDPSGLTSWRADTNLVKKMRASYYLLAVLLARFGQAEVALPGGDDIGPRPIDQHIKGFRALGAQSSIEHGLVKLQAKRMVGHNVYLDVLTVGATVNLILAAVMAEGTTTIFNAYRGPFIVDLANFLNAMGARIYGAGTETIRIRGVSKLHGCRHAIIPDQSEAATLMVAGAMTQGDVTLINTIPDHLDAIIAKLQETGAQVTVSDDDSIRVKSERRPQAVNVKTLPLPGFFTDFQAPMSALLTVADGTSIVTESIWDERFEHLNQMVKMGAKARIDGRTALIEGVSKLTGAEVTGTDLRAAAALLIAGMAAEGETIVNGFDHADRGYQRLDEKLNSLGARIKRL